MLVGRCNSEKPGLDDFSIVKCCHNSGWVTKLPILEADPKQANEGVARQRDPARRGGIHGPGRRPAVHEREQPSGGEVNN